MNPAPDKRESIVTTGLQVAALVVAIGVLVFLFYAMIANPGPRAAARRAMAKQDVLAIVHAVETYVTDYSSMPDPEPRAGRKTHEDDMAVGDPAAGMRLSNATLFDILRDIDRAPNADSMQNPKHQIYFAARSVSSTAKPKDGFLEVPSKGGTQGAFYDPWGRQYNIVLDSNSDNTIDLKASYLDLTGDKALRVSVGAFALGKDMELGKGGDKKLEVDKVRSDDIVSWSTR